ncbi:SDR family NAD(P)-dependent oxidoreductase [Scytonema sp. UIC 10036]|uniref:type I polyketide synthase n=1 Tax=Scytonema sp. UIC 10036 TaxID=2304196 RepID=UPI0012DA3664|nr:type I polyketide synthase [Scytonema sp. UIC 10036]MUG94286.1 SDR family NAD(P)-dependent oxidoreductase [Scytonema sp. UIC 10036]
MSQADQSISPIKRALLAVEHMQAKLEAVETAKKEPIALVGMGCRFPGGVLNPEALWQLLRDGVDAVTEVPANRWDINALYDPNPETPGKMYTRYGGFISQLEDFDAQFFGIAPREAVSLDPQQRMLLEVSWEAIESANISPAQLLGSQTGVFVGISANDYLHRLVSREATEIDAYQGTGTVHSIAAGRLSYLLGLTGPSIALDTACSSSLVAVHLACQSLRNHECNLALAGGVNLLLSSEISINLSKARMLSPDGRCKTFDAKADGYVRSEGCGVIILKRLSDAVKDNDLILALIRGSAVNQDGRSSGLTAPNGLMQQAVIRQALENGGVEPSEVSYIEAHGTGTALGDPIEVEALAAVFGNNRAKDQPLTVGSLKTNIGHLESAAGIAGLIKVVLQFQHQEIAPHLHFQHPSPYIDWENLPLIVPTQRTQWHTGENPRLAGVSSFGFSGTNAHVILAQPPTQKPQPTSEVERPFHLLTLSAKTPSALEQLAFSYQNYIQTQTEISIADICYTANTGRSHFHYRLAMVADSREQLVEQLTSPDTTITNGVGSQLTIAFLFSGQGSQYINMGRQLYETQPIFRETLQQCNEILRPYLKPTLLEVLYPTELSDHQRSSLLDQTAYTQPALFAVEYALYQLWKSWGIEPDVVMGHSVGEYVAATVAGVFSLEDGLKLIAQRGRLMQELPGGEMVSVKASQQQVAEIIAQRRNTMGLAQEDVALAAINGSESVVISGAREDVSGICQQLEQQGIKTKRLQVSHAFHSPLMTPMLKEFERVANGVAYNQPQIPLVSNVTGLLANENIATADYWVNHVCQTVQFASSMQALQDYEVFLEIGPKPILLGMGRECIPERERLWLPSLRPGVAEWKQLLSSLSQLYVAGVEVDWSGFERGYARKKVALPTYPFQRQRYWIENSSPARRGQKSTKLHPLLDKKLQLPLSQDIVFESEFSTSTKPFLAEHKVYDQVVVPGAAYLSLLLGAASLTFSTQACRLENIVFPQALAIPSGEARTVQLVLSPQGSAKSFQLISFDAATDSSNQVSKLLVHATGFISPSMNTTPQTIAIEEILARCTQQIDKSEIYSSRQKRQIQFGASFQGLDIVWCGEGEALAKIKWLDLGDEQQEYQLYPGLIDSCLQLTGMMLPQEDTFVPFAIESFRFEQRPQTQQLWCYTRLREQQNSNINKFIADIKLFDFTGQLIAEMIGMEAKKVTRQLLLPSHNLDVTDWLYEIDWQALDLEQSTQAKGGSWLIFTDSQGIGQQLAEKLQQLEGDCILVSAGVKYEKRDRQHYQIDPSQPEHFQKLLLEIDSTQPLGIVHLWSIAPDETALSDLPTAELHNCGSVLHLVQALAQIREQRPPHLWLVTQGTQAVSLTSEPLRLTGSSLWGLGRVIALEYPEFQCVLVDLPVAGTRQQHTQAILWELSASRYAEAQIAYRDDKRYVARLVRHTASYPQKQLTTDEPMGVAESRDDSCGTEGKMPAPKIQGKGEIPIPQKDKIHPANMQRQPVQLKISEYGLLDNLSLLEMKRRLPQMDEVEIQVQASTVNFRDVLNALGMLKEYYAEKMGITQASHLTFGFECAGIIATVGENVSHLQVGDEVVAWVTTHDALSSFVTLAATTVVKKPTNLSFQQAATTPLAFLTAQYGLHTLAQLQPGERVLIHAAAGGVGQAAVQIALNAGAEVFATASIHKWEFLKSMGVKHVMNSRSLDFADEVMSLTQGQGVDVVLNSFNGEFIPKNLQVLSNRGRFVEIGKIGIWDESQVRDIREDVSYFAFDLGEVQQKQPDLIPSMLQQLMAQLHTGTLKPLPQTVFPLEQVVNAFRYMATAKHIGKVVISMPPIKPKVNGDRLSVKPDVSYWITGGLGALGLEVAGWLVEKGARNLVLTGRSQGSVATKERISEFEQLGVRVLVVKADVSQVTQVEEVIKKISSELPPLRGIIHAAGVLDDGVLKQQSQERFEQVMAPKVAGAWNLHNLTQHLPIEFFVCFSSISSVFGSGGQGNYGAANAFMDSLAHYRQTLGLPGLSINWGPWSQVGMAASLDSGNQNRIQGAGIGTISTLKGLTVLEQLLNQYSAQVAVIPINWSQFISESMASAFFANFTQTSTKTVEQSEFRTRLAAAKASERKKLLIDHICLHLTKVLGINLSTRNLQQGFFELGMDSLTSVELRNRLQNSLGCSLPSSLTFDYPTVTLLADYLSKEVLSIEPSGIEQQASDRSDLSTTLDKLSESEIEKLLAQELAVIEESKGQ